MYDKGSGETAVISVMTHLAWSEKFVLQLADPSWLRQSAICAVAVGLIHRLRRGHRDEFCHCTFQTGWPLKFPKDSGKTSTLKRACLAYHVLIGSLITVLSSASHLMSSPFDQWGNAHQNLLPHHSNHFLTCCLIFSCDFHLFSF